MYDSILERRDHSNGHRCSAERVTAYLIVQIMLFKKLMRKLEMRPEP